MLGFFFLIQKIKKKIVVSYLFFQIFEQSGPAVDDRTSLSVYTQEIRSGQNDVREVSSRDEVRSRRLLANFNLTV